MEGVVLYVLLVRVFIEGSQKRYAIKFTVVSYGEKFNDVHVGLFSNILMFTQACLRCTCVLLFLWDSC